MNISGATGATDATAASLTAGTSQAGQSQAKLQEDMNQFLKLLVTQLKNQDPLNPMDATQFTTQLVQFASVEQQIHTNANMEKLVNLQETSQISTMVNFIGNAAKATSSSAPLQDGHMEFAYTLDQSAKSVQISIQNDKGITVFFADGDTKTGTHSFTWDGAGANGAHNPDGAYTIVVTAKDAADKLINVAQTVTGTITGAGVTDGKANLFMGDVVIPMDKIVTVEKPFSAGLTN